MRIFSALILSSVFLFFSCKKSDAPRESNQLPRKIQAIEMLMPGYTSKSRLVITYDNLERVTNFSVYSYDPDNRPDAGLAEKYEYSYRRSEMLPYKAERTYGSFMTVVITHFLTYQDNRVILDSIIQPGDPNSPDGKQHFRVRFEYDGNKVKKYVTETATFPDYEYEVVNGNITKSRSLHVFSPNFYYSHSFDNGIHPMGYLNVAPTVLAMVIDDETVLNWGGWTMGHKNNRTEIYTGGNKPQKTFKTTYYADGMPEYTVGYNTDNLAIDTFKYEYDH